MRSDWDPEHKKRPDLQRRAPGITTDEWRYIHECVVMDYEAGLADNLPLARLHWQQRLIEKIDKRILDEVPKGGG
jgi:hypothetical protein